MGTIERSEDEDKEDIEEKEPNDGGLSLMGWMMKERKKK
jgi:hypothetical protein